MNEMNVLNLQKLNNVNAGGSLSESKKVSVFRFNKHGKSKMKNIYLRILYLA